MKNDLLKILKGAVITETKNGIFINKYVYDYSCKEISYSLFNTLYNIGLITLDSGNFETFEKHYILNENYVTMKNNIKHVNLKKITDLIRCHSHIQFVTSEFCDSYFLIEKNLKRKEKLKKINEKKMYM